MVRKAGLLILSFVVIALTGCSNKSTAPTDTTSADQASVQTTLASTPQLTDDGLFDTNVPSGFSAHGSPGVLTGIGGDGGGGGEDTPTPPSPDRRWWRVIDHVTPSFEYEFTETDSTGRPSRAHVTLHKHLTGTFHLVWGEVVTGSAGQDSIVMHEMTKPLADHWVRQIWLARGRGIGRDWHVVAASGISVTSEGDDAGAQPSIQSIRIQAGEADTTFSDPSAAIHWNQLWAAPAGTEVMVTVTTTAANDVVVLMHHDNRLALTANGDNTYSGSWMTPLIGGLKHFGVNALSQGTVMDGAYHSNAWLFPYINRGESYGM